MSTLQSFLERPSRPADALGYHAVQGFLFAISCSPDLIPASEWITVVFEEEPEFDSEDEANAVLGDLMTLYNAINQAILDRAPRLPDDCPLDPDPKTNFAPDAPLGQWSQGFHAGHSWLVETWDEFLPEGVEPSSVASRSSVATIRAVAAADGSTRSAVWSRRHADTNASPIAFPPPSLLPGCSLPASPATIFPT